MLDWILEKLGLLRMSYYDELVQSSQVLLVDIYCTYDLMEQMLESNLPPEVKVLINQYLADHEWITEYNINIITEDNYFEN